MPGATPKSDSIYSDWGGDLKVILHEYIHSFTYDIVGEDRINKIPFLFTEGIALYTSKQIYLNSNFKKIIHQRLEQNAVPKFQILMINKHFLTIKHSYHWSFLFINYIIDNYGWDTFLDIQNNFEDYNKILKKKDKEINQDWFQYLESNRLKI